MIEVVITEEMIERAKVKSQEMGKLRNSITEGDGNEAGYLGEEVANMVIGGEISNTYEYDIVKGDITYDVKTKRCTSEPRPYYDCSVAEFNIKQDCDRYVFVRIERLKNAWSRAWVLGYCDKIEYFNKARKLEKGETDGDNGFVVKSNCYNLKISQLIKI